ncbi:MAG TPA: diguanylate cyclase [Kofleriaceae bacterium]
MSKGPPTKPPKKKPDLGPIDEDDVEAAFSSIRLGSEPIGAEPRTQVDDEIGIKGDEDVDEDSFADITGADELTNAHDELVVGGAEFAPEHTELADVRKADSPSRRAQTNPAILDEIIDENFERPVPQVDRLHARSAPPVPGPRFSVSVPKTIPPPNKAGPADKKAKPITGVADVDDPPTDAWANAKYKEVPEGRALPRALSQAGAQVPARRERAMTAAEKAAHAAKSRLAAKQGQAAPSTSPTPRQPTHDSPAVRAVAQRQETQSPTAQRLAAPAPQVPTPQPAPQVAPQRVSAPMAAVAPQQTGPVQRTSASMAAVAPQQTAPVQRTSASVATQMPRTAPPGPPPGSRVERLPLPPPRQSLAAFEESVALEAATIVPRGFTEGPRAQSFDIDVADLEGGRGGTLDRALDSALATRDEDLEADDAAHHAALERALEDEEEDGDDDFGVLAEPLPPPPPSRLPRVDLAARNKPQPIVADVKPTEVAQAVAHSADFAVEVPNPLRVAVHETAPNLQSAGLAIAGAGHLMTLGASGREGLAKIHKACTQGEIDAVIVGLPGGEWLIQAALSLGGAAPIVIAACDGKPTDAIRTASAAGAALVAMRPHDPGRIAPVLLAASRMAENRRDMSEAREKEASLIARLDSHAEGHEAELGDLQPFDLFKRTLELELKRVKRYQYALSVALFALEVPEASPPGVRGLLRARAGNALVQSIRDIDMATVLDQDRFLVLLPYTDLNGATHVARRILSAVDALPPLKMGGVTVQAQLTGAIAGAKPGTQVSLGKLMKDATRALEAARRDGAELAVQP